MADHTLTKSTDVCKKRTRRQNVNRDLEYDNFGNILSIPDGAEKWKVIQGYPNYTVSNLGRIMRVTRGAGTNPGTIIAGCKNHDGYLRVKIPRATFVHVLVAEAFLGNCPEGLECNHKDGVKENCRVDNLEYLTHKANMGHAAENGLMASGERAGGAKLTEQDIREILRMHKRGFSNRGIAEIFGVDNSTVCVITQGKTWKHLFVFIPESGVADPDKNPESKFRHYNK